MEIADAAKFFGRLLHAHDITNSMLTNVVYIMQTLVGSFFWTQCSLLSTCLMASISFTACMFRLLCAFHHVYMVGGQAHDVSRCLPCNKLTSLLFALSITAVSYANIYICIRPASFIVVDQSQWRG